MTTFIKSFLLILSISAPALAADSAVVEQEKYELSCDVGAVCLEQSLKLQKHEFHIAPGSSVRVEVSAKNGASITLVSGGNTMSASYLSVGTGIEGKQSVELQADVDSTGNFTLDVQIPKITINGKPQVADGGAYNLKITRVGAGKAVPSSSAPSNGKVEGISI